MTGAEHHVAIVVDPAFGKRLYMLSRRLHVWACGSPRNRMAAQRIWSTRSVPSLETGITVFDYDENEPPDETCLAILDTVDLHHGESSHDPEWSVLEVYGSPLTPALKSALRRLGVTRFESVHEGFRALRFL